MNTENNSDILFVNEISLPVFREFLGYTPSQPGGSDSESTVCSLARLDTWIAVCVTSMRFPIPRGAQAQRLYVEETSRLYKPTLRKLLDCIYPRSAPYAPGECRIREGGECTGPPRPWADRGMHVFAGTTILSTRPPGMVHSTHQQ